MFFTRDNFFFIFTFLYLPIPIVLQHVWKDSLQNMAPALKSETSVWPFCLCEDPFCSSDPLQWYWGPFSHVRLPQVKQGTCEYGTFSLVLPRFFWEGFQTKIHNKELRKVGCSILKAARDCQLIEATKQAQMKFTVFLCLFFLCARVTWSREKFSLPVGEFFRRGEGKFAAKRKFLPRIA